jgi:large subunit ribosomal protein L17
MRHGKRGVKLNRTSSHRKALMRSLATALFEHKKIATTEVKAKALRPFAERLITKAKKALAREKQGLLPEGQTVDIHNRRVVFKVIKNKAVLQELFDAIAPAVESRNGGYTRIIKTGQRRGDGARTAIIELVDWSAEQDGAVSIKPKKKSQPKKVTPKVEVKVTPVVEEKVEEVIETPAEEVVANEEVAETAAPEVEANQEIKAEEEKTEDKKEEN